MELGLSLGEQCAIGCYADGFSLAAMYVQVHGWCVLLLPDPVMSLDDDVLDWAGLTSCLAPGAEGLEGGLDNVPC